LANSLVESVSYNLQPTTVGVTVTDRWCSAFATLGDTISDWDMVHAHSVHGPSRCERSLWGFSQCGSCIVVVRFL